MPLSAWVGPAIIATLIASMVQIAGWWMEHRRERVRQTESRRERIIDVQTAIRAEIRSHRHRLLQFVETRRAGPPAGPDAESFQPFVPSEVRPFVLEAILKDITILPTDVIDPVIVYYRQVLALIQLVEDIRSKRFRALEAQKRLVLFGDYIAMGAYAAELAAAAIGAIGAIDRDLGVESSVNSSGADRSDPKSAAAGRAEGGGDLQT